VFLKRIEIYGFKSFAGRSVLDFEYLKNGNITAVVGPNGSGKSNVADAIRWVTGEQSSKNLRSKKSEDVIFSGSSVKPRGSYASVSLLLSSDKPVRFEINNKQHELTEIEVARKLYRSGESEYLINHKKVRLTDIQQLLASLGFGQSSYTVIGQGMVDRLLFFTASERKVLFDEAAGVKQYEIKREQAIRKLESTDSNLIRLKDILSELEPRVANLRRLVKRAEGRKEFEVELTHTQQQYFGSLAFEYGKTVAETKLKQSELNKRIVQINQNIEALEAKQAEKSRNPHTQERRDIESQISKCTSERDRLMRDTAYLRGQVESLGRNHLLLTSKKSELSTEKTTLTIKIDFLEAKLSAEQVELGASRELVAGLSLPADELTREIETTETELKLPQTDNSSRTRELRDTIRDVSSRRLISEEAAARLVDLGSAESTLKLEIKSARETLKKFQGEADKLQGELGGLEIEVRKLSSLVNPVTLSTLEKAIKELESYQIDAPDFKAKLNKIFIQFRDISKAINSEERAKLETSIEVLRKSSNAAMERLVSTRVLLATKESTLSQLEAQIAQNKIKANQGDLQSIDLEALKAELSQYEGSASERQNILLRKKDSLQEKLSEAREKLHLAQIERNRLQTLVTNQESEFSGAKRRLEVVEKSLSEIGLSSDQDNSELESKLVASEKELNRKEEDLAKYRGGLTQVITAEREFEQAGQVFEREKRLLLDSKNTIISQLSTLEVEVAKTQVRLEDVNEEIRLGNIQLPGGVSYDYLDQMEKDVLKLKMENLRRKLETIGGVDPETAAEYDELEARSTAMSEQVTDLSKAKLDLEKVVTELDDRIRKQFATVFSSISSEFSRYFSMLFGGGTANLKFGENEEGSFGIDISANPPGKRATSLNALSGGERTLTSLALLFAILSVNPSPFCVLDEVDAALDESNTVRFIKILEDLATKTQFIVISHNRDTMKSAASLYGVTMDESHVSKLLSVKLTEALVSEKK